MKDKLQLVQVTDELLVLMNRRGVYSVIKYLGLNKPKMALGYQLCPSGKKQPQFNVIMKSIQKYVEELHQHV